MTQITNLGAEKIILGIDPGTRYLGYGLIRITRDKVHVLQYGVLNLTKYTTQGAKFLKIHERVMGIVEEFMPDEIAIELKNLNIEPDYNFHVKPILSDKCFACHGPDKMKQKAGLRLDIAKNAYASLPESPDKVAITPGNLRKSEFFHRIISNDPNIQMPEPSSHLTLTNREKAILIRWIENGAEYKPHWALVTPVLPNLPKSKWKNKVENDIDLFIHKRLAEEKIEPSEKSSKELLLRRLSLDLTGLPPSLDDLDDFIKDKSPNAYEKQVDKLLASPHYGEKMAVHWLDIARFADSHGYTVDRLREMSPYRDWVISAFNRNMRPISIASAISVCVTQQRQCPCWTKASPRA